MATITVTDALAELTLLEKRILSATGALGDNTLIAIVKVEKVPTGFNSRQEHATKARAALQRVEDLISRRRIIKRAIVLSNASTMVTVANEEMTVAEAIEMKNFIHYYDGVLNIMQLAHKQTLKQFQVEQAKVQERLDKLALEVFGKNETVSSEEYQSLADSFLAREGVELLDPTNLAEELERRQGFIEEFTSTVDRVLSISNARTMIEIPD